MKFFQEIPNVFGIFPATTGVGAGLIRAVCVSIDPTVIIVPVIDAFFI